MINVDTETETVQVKASCLLSQTVRKDILMRVSHNLNQHQYFRALIDLSEAVFNPNEYMMSAVDLTNYMRNIGLPPNVKLGFVYTEAGEFRKFFETVARMDGWDLRYFTDPDEASLWLAKPSHS